MSPERSGLDTLTSVDKIVLASRVNRLCAVEIGDDFDTNMLLGDAQAIVNTFDSALKVSSGFYVKGTIRGRSGSFGGLASTNIGQFQENLESGKKSKDIQLGQVYEDRIGLYKITKTDEEYGLALNLAYFMTQISTDGDLISIGPSTHILYDRKDLSIKGVVKSKPVLFRFLDMTIVWFKQSNLWGKARLSSLALEFLR